jgi:hypothetical protein
MRDPDDSKKHREIKNDRRRVVVHTCCRRPSDNVRHRMNWTNDTEQNTFQFSISHGENESNNGLKATKLLYELTLQ